MSGKYDEYLSRGGTRSLEDLRSTIQANLQYYPSGTTEDQALEWLLDSLIFNESTSLNQMLGMAEEST